MQHVTRMPDWVPDPEDDDESARAGFNEPWRGEELFEEEDDE